MLRARLIACAGFIIASSGCIVEGTVGSLAPLTVADARADAVRADAVVLDAGTDAMAMAMDSAAEDAGADARADARELEASGPEVPLCGAEGECPLGRYCSRTLCQAPWSGCNEDEKCNGLDDDCDGVADNGINCGSGDPCPTGQARCNGTCVDLATDNQHCGRCDRPCPSGMCMIGYCR